MEITKSKIFEVFEDDKKRLYTVNLTPGKKVYDEKLIKCNGIEYRAWNPRKSKLAAMILKGCSNIFIRKNDVVLYLGAASGTTVSHVSDIVSEGFVFALDFAPRVVRELVFLAEERSNIAPILADANKPASYLDKVSQADIIYQDIAQRDQLTIFLKNVKMFLKKDGYAILAVKAKSIDIARKSKGIFNEIRQKLESEMKIIDSKILEPYELDHIMFICKP
ncbi:MAG: fibrillarin-like rRNA/tRNA 2'-O-methyltransferase [Nanoarchaeota archaeon]